MGSWYWIGVCAGLGAGIGVLFAGLAGGGRAAIAASVVAAFAGAAVGFGIDSWQPGGWGDVAAGAVGAALGALGAGQIVSGALRRGGTRGGTAILVGAGSLAVAALAFVPVLGFIEALTLPVLARRLKKRTPETYAGLRTLAKD